MSTNTIRLTPSPWDRPQLLLTSAKTGESLGAFLGDQRFEAHSHERGFLTHAGQAGRSLKGIGVDIQCRSHTYKYALIRHTMQVGFLGAERLSPLPAMLLGGWNSGNFSILVLAKIVTAAKLTLF